MLGLIRTGINIPGCFSHKRAALKTGLNTLKHCEDALRSNHSSHIRRWPAVMIGPQRKCSVNINVSWCVPDNIGRTSSSLCGRKKRLIERIIALKCEWSLFLGIPKNGEVIPYLSEWTRGWVKNIWRIVTVWTIDVRRKKGWEGLGINYSGIKVSKERRELGWLIWLQRSRDTFKIMPSVTVDLSGLSACDEIIWDSCLNWDWTLNSEVWTCSTFIFTPMGNLEAPVQLKHMS